MTNPRHHHRAGPVRAPLATAAVLLAAALASAGCAPLLIGGAVAGTALSVNDRRTAGALFEDQAIEIKAFPRLRQTLGDGRGSATSYNRTVLLTGEATSAADRAAAEQAVARIDNVRAVVNELAVVDPLLLSSLPSRAGDTLLTGRVKAALLDTPDLHAQAVKVVTERGVVHLMGLVTEREAARASDVARSVPGVAKVVRVFEVVGDAELLRLGPLPGR